MTAGIGVLLFPELVMKSTVRV